MKHKVLVVIPARFDSTRLPGKPLKLIGGAPMIQRVHERAAMMRTADRIIVATDDERILNGVKLFGGEAVMTSPDHKSGTDRVAEAARDIDCDIVVNIQGDEPFIDPAAVDSAVRALLDDPSAKAATLCVEAPPGAGDDPNVTKVVRDLDGRALYFSKLPIPNNRDGGPRETPLLKHLGTYVFRKDFLMWYASLEPTPLEKAEKLEQLRILEHGEKMLVVKTGGDSLGVDSPEDLAQAEAMAEKEGAR
ncbi:MAG: 3-deoxy-manno-octulosonate cytidylyltransferase [Candidatus Nitrospinota bacterium M3_3B_026]